MPPISHTTAPLEQYYLNIATASRRYEELSGRFAHNPNMLAELEREYSAEMAKGVPAIGLGDLAASIPQDLDPVYRSLDVKAEGLGRNTLLRIIPKIQGYARTHEYALQTSTGLGGTSGASTEYGVGNFMRPVQSAMSSSPRWLKLHYMRSRSADDVRTIGDFSEQQVRLNLRRLANQMLIWGDTRKQFGGVAGLGAKGLIQLIEEGTSGTAGLGTSGYNYQSRGHTWDWKGQAPSIELMRQGPRELFHLWGSASSLNAFMPSRTLAGLEALSDANRRGSDPFAFAFQGQAVTGILVGGMFVPYIPDDDLSPFARDSRGLYNITRPEGAPAGAPTCVVVQQNEGTTDSLTFGLWDENPYGAGDVRYVPTYFDENDMESRGTLTGATTVSSGGTKEVKITISDVPANATRVRIYRYDAEYGTARGISSPAATDACWVFDVAPPGDGSPIVVIDHNQKRPYCGTGLLLNVASDTLPYLTGRTAFDNAVRENAFENIMPFVSEAQTNWAENAVREVYVGPTMLTHMVANTMDTRLNYLMACWRSVEVTNPFTCGVLQNLPLV